MSELKLKILLHNLTHIGGVFTGFNLEPCRLDKLEESSQKMFWSGLHCMN